MKVKDLIKKLSTLDQDALVVSRDYDGSFHVTLPIGRVYQKHRNSGHLSIQNPKDLASNLELGSDIKNIVYIDIFV